MREILLRGSRIQNYMKLQTEDKVEFKLDRESDINSKSSNNKRKSSIAQVKARLSF
jgi:hypothetical protein